MQQQENSVAPADLDLDRFRAYLATPVEDLHSRSTFGITDDELYKFHRCIRPDIVRNQNRELQILYRSVSIADRADRIFLISDGRWPIAQIRKHLRRIESRTFQLGQTQVAESIYYRYWPLAALIVRELSGPSALTYELEWVDQGDSLDLDTASKRWWPGFEEESLLLCRDFPQEESVKQLAFLPPEGVHYRLIFSAGQKRKVFEFPVSLRYEHLLLSFVDWRGSKAGRYTLERVRYEPKNKRKERPQRYSSVEIAEGQMGLWIATQNFEPDRVEQIPGYIEHQLIWHMGNAFDEVSTTGLERFRSNDRKRILESDLDFSGGSLDQEIQDSESGETSTMINVLPDETQPSLENLVNANFDRVMQKLAPNEQTLMCMNSVDRTREEMSATLGISKDEVSRQTTALRKKIRKILTT